MLTALIVAGAAREAEPANTTAHEAFVRPSAQSQKPPAPPPPPAAKIPPLTIKGTEHMIDVGGRRLHCAVYGSGGRPSFS
ncbi:MAG: hypothetical protein MZU91_10930 [Desulfosudis oleivorans]|nr:hypothetical protein [Desulfosudis oleivorans]